MVCFCSGYCCLSVDISMLRCRNQAVASLERSTCCGTGDISKLRCWNCCCGSGSKSAALLCSVVLVSLTILKRAVSKRNRGCPQVTFGIALKKTGADFHNFTLKKAFDRPLEFSSEKNWFEIGKILHWLLAEA